MGTGLLTWLVDGVKPPTHWEDGPGGRAQELKDGVAAVLALLGSLAKGRGDLDKAWSAEQTNAILSLLLTITQEGLGPERTGDAQEQDAWDQTHVAGQLLHAWCTLIPFGTFQKRSFLSLLSFLCSMFQESQGLGAQEVSLVRFRVAQARTPRQGAMPARSPRCCVASPHVSGRCMSHGA